MWRSTFPAGCLLLTAGGVTLSGCAEYRQTALGVTPASECADMAHGCGDSQVQVFWTGGDSVEPGCEPGLAEYTVRTRPLENLVSALTLTIVSLSRVEWKCARPNPAAGGGLTDPAPPPATTESGDPGGVHELVLTGKVQTNVFWVLRLGEPPKPDCGPNGMAAARVRRRPLETLVTALTLTIVAPRRIEWSCVVASGGS